MISMSVDFPVCGAPVMMFNPECRSIRRRSPRAFQTAMVLIHIMVGAPIAQRQWRYSPIPRTSDRRTSPWRRMLGSRRSAHAQRLARVRRRRRPGASVNPSRTTVPWAREKRSASVTSGRSNGARSATPSANSGWLRPARHRPTSVPRKRFTGLLVKHCRQPNVDEGPWQTPPSQLAISHRHAIEC